MATNDYIVILHGIFRSSKHMAKLACQLKSKGYDVLNLDYPSSKYPLELLVDIIWDDIKPKLTDEKPIHFIGYSLGGLLVRALLSKYQPNILGRVVLLAPPNNGSEVADVLKNTWIYKKLYGPAGQQLITNQTQIAKLFTSINYECGVIAGNFSIDPFCSFFIKGENDGKVSVESTKVRGMQDHIIINATHTWFPHNKKVHLQTLNFLQNGSFNHKINYSM